MSYPTPTLAEIDARLQAELPASAETEAMRRNLYEPLAAATAGAVYSLWGYVDWVARQIHPQDCDDQVLEDAFASFWLSSGRKAPSNASGTITVYGTAGTGITQDARWTYGKHEYAPLAEVIMPDSGSVVMAVVCLTAGQTGNVVSGAKLTLANPIAGIQQAAIVAAPGITGGADIESYEALRQRVLDVRAAGGDTGKTADWERWALEVPGVTRAWCIPHFVGFGTTVVFFVRDGDEDIFPDDQEVATTTAHLRDDGTPFGEVHGASPVRRVIDVTLSIVPDTPTNRTEAEEALRKSIAIQAAPVDREKLKAGLTRGVTIRRSHLTEALSAVSGEVDHTLTVPAGNVSCAPGELAVLGAVTWS